MRVRTSGLSMTLYGAVLMLGASTSGCTDAEGNPEPNAANSTVTKDGGTEQPVKATVFQAAGPSAASIQSTVDEFRVALGGENNGNVPGPLQAGRREINWDGGGSSATSPGATPFDVFLDTRGLRATTPGTGFVQAPPSGMAETFNNPTYANIFVPFSPLRLFSPVGSNVTDTLFFVPGTAGATPASTRAFGLILADVDQPDGTSNQRPSTSVEYFDDEGKLLFRSFAPASPGDGGLTFFGIVLDDARIARVRVRTGNSAPGPDDTKETDIVMMDDFIYAEPEALPADCHTASASTDI